MKHIIAHLRTKPDHHKKAIAFGSALVVSAMVFSVWFSTQPFFQSDSVIIAEANKEGPIEAMGEVLASALEGFKNIFK